ncbi:domain of subtilisin, partial [Chrysochromulina tobinii]
MIYVVINLFRAQGYQPTYHRQPQPSQDKTFSSPTAVGETPGSSYQLHEDNNASAAAGQTTATALTSTATQSDETYSCELATINGEPGSLYQRTEGNASAASSEQTWYCIDITVSIAVAFAAVATAVESSVAAVLTSAAAATTLLGGDFKDRLSGYSIAIIAAVAVLAAVASCSRWISDPERELKTGTNLSGTSLLPGDRVLCPQSAWVGSSGCVASTVTDPYYETNAWAYTLINLQPAWAAGYTGAGVTINIVDDGPDETHPDFSGKYDALGSCPTHTTGSHGTTTAAIALAAGNGQCSRGVAYGATLSKCGMHETDTNRFIGSLTRNHISSNSWGTNSCASFGDERRKLRQRQLQGCPFAATAASGTSPCSAFQCAGASWTSPPSMCNTVISTYCQNAYNYDADGECASWTYLWTFCFYTGELNWATQRVLQRGVLEGRSGRGIVYVMSSGNEHSSGEDVNMERKILSRFTIFVGATDKLGLHSYYSETGSSLFISAPGGDTTQHLNNWHVAATGSGCAEQGQGTSYACPVVSGVVALMLQANPLLGWRDVQGILAATTSRNDPTSSLWTTNAAGFIHNIKYGFGMVDAGAAVAAALSWTNWGIERRIFASSSQQLTVPYNGSTLSTSVTVGAQSQAWAIEWIEIFLNLDHSSRGDLQLELTSPSGTHSVLIPGPRPEISNPPVMGCSAAADTCSTKDNGVCDNPST